MGNVYEQLCSSLPVAIVLKTTIYLCQGQVLSLPTPPHPLTFPLNNNAVTGQLLRYTNHMCIKVGIIM